jgi:putative FmdB family regulatory protein
MGWMISVSKLILFQFACTKCGNSFEDLAKPGDYWCKCPECGANAKREITPVRIDNTAFATQEGATPTSIDRWDRMHQQRKKIEEKRMRDHGDYGKAAGSD